MHPLQRWAPALGRILLSLIFLASAAGKIADWPGTAAAMVSEGMPAVPLFLAGAVALELGGGLSLLLGWKTRWGALALLLFLVPATLVFHDFWTFEAEAAREQMIHFLKNLALMGGLLLVAGLGPGPVSVDGDGRGGR